MTPETAVRELKSHFQTLVESSHGFDDDNSGDEMDDNITNANINHACSVRSSDDNYNSFPDSTIDATLDSIKEIFAKYHHTSNDTAPQYNQEKSGNVNALALREPVRGHERVVTSDNTFGSSNGKDDPDKENRSTHESSFIRTNLAHYNGESQQPATSCMSNISLRSILESKAQVTKLQTLFAHLMTTSTTIIDDENHIHCPTSTRTSTRASSTKTSEEIEDKLDVDFQTKQHNLSLTALKACHVYLQSCLLPGSWSCGWIDVVTIRYIETLIRKWSLFCCEYKMILNNIDDLHNSGELHGNRRDHVGRLKRSRVSDDYEQDGKAIGTTDGSNIIIDLCAQQQQEEYIYQLLQLGIEISQTMGHVLLYSQTSSFWNWNEECRDAFLDSLVLSFSTCAALTTTFSQGSTIGSSNKRQKMKALYESCTISVYDIARSLEASIIASIEHEMVSVGRLKDCDDDDDDLTVSYFSPSTYVQGCDENGNSCFTSSSVSRATTITLLRNIYPLLTYQNNVPNGVKGKQEVFDKCEELLSNMVKKLSLKLKTSNGETDISMNLKSIQTPGMRSNANSDDMITPLSGRTRRNRSSLSPKSTNRKRIPQNKDDLNGLLNVPPSLKKSVTPKRASHRKSLSRQQHSIKTSVKSTERRLKQYELKEKYLKDILDMFLAIMQKLSTGKMMDRVEVRNRISNLISSMLNNMKGMYVVSFASFVIRLCSSKISSHRVFGVELLSSFLVKDWLWEIDVANQRNNALHKFDSELISLSQDRTKRQSIDSEFPQNQSVHFDLGESDYNFLSALGSNQNSKHISNEILSALHDRLKDRSPAVRARAAVALGSVFNELQNFSREPDEVLKLVLDTSIVFSPYLISTLRQRAYGDDKATVRKAAIQTMVEILKFDIHNIRGERNCILTQDDVSVLCHLCEDNSIAVRKVAAEALISLLINVRGKSLTNDMNSQIIWLESAWVHSVMPIIHDSEQSCAMKVVESFESLIILPLVEALEQGSAAETSERSLRLNSCWRILGLVNSDTLASGESKGVKNILQTITMKSFESKDTRVKRNQSKSIMKLFNRIMTTFQHSNEEMARMEFEAIWCMLEILGTMDCNANPAGVINLRTVLRDSGFKTEVLTASCKKFLGRVDQINEEKTDSRWTSLVATKSSLNTISSFAPYLTRDEMKSLAVDLKAATKSFQFVIDLIGPSTKALISLASAFCLDGTHSNVIDTCTDWIKEIYYGCEANLNIYISAQRFPSHVDDTNLARVIYTVGEMCMVGYKPDEDNSKQLTALRSKSNGDSSANPIIGLHIHPSNRLIRLIQSFLPHTLPSTDETPGREVSSVIRAHAFVTFGKLCLRDESLTKEHLNVFAKELSNNGPDSDDAVRSNALLVLGDLCITYTNLVDKFIPLMASCLQPSHECVEKSKSSIVQQHALILFSNLILQGYIKWKGILFHRFAAATVANDLSVSTLAKALLSGPIIANDKTLILNNFVSSLFVLNGCYPQVINKGKRSSLSNDVILDRDFSLKIDDFGKRLGIYRFLLDNIQDEEKIAITARLAKEVLSSAAETSGPLSKAASRHGGVDEGQDGQLYGAYCVLSDCFAILTDTRLMIVKSTCTDTADYEDLNSTVTSITSVGPTSAQLSSVKTRLLSKIRRKHLIESMVPILCNLKVVLEKSRSPLLKDLMKYLVCIFRQFKQEVNEVLESDATLLQEIKYDTRKFEKIQSNEVSIEVAE